MIFTIECSPPTNIKFTITKAPIKAINGFFTWLKLVLKMPFVLLKFTPKSGNEINTVITNGINAGT